MSATQRYALARTPAASWTLVAGVAVTVVLAGTLLVDRAPALVFALVLAPPAAVLPLALAGFTVRPAGAARALLGVAIGLGGIGLLGQLAAVFTPAVLGVPAGVLLCLACVLRLNRL